jgi:hypothetical protein
VRIGVSRSPHWLPAKAVGVLFLVLPPLACGGGRTADNPFQRAETEERVVLRVENQNMSDARIYIRPRGRRTLLATVETRDLRYLEFAWPGRAPLDLEVELIVGDRYRFPPLSMAPGMRVELLIASQLRRSTLRQ